MSHQVEAIEKPSVDDYQPSAKNLQHFLRTGKYGRNASLPGLIGTHGYAVPLFALAILAELWGLACLYAVAGISPIFVLLLFILDLGAALLAHVTAKERCIQRFLRLIHDPVVPGSQEDLIITARVSTFAKLIAGAGCILIIVLAVGKGMAVQHFKDNLSDEAQGPIFLTTIAAYAVAALIHLRYTGDAIFEILRWCIWPFEKSTFENGLKRGDNTVDGWPQRNVRRFTSPVPLLETRFGKQGGQHELRKVGEDDGNEYELQTESTLTDEDVQHLCQMLLRLNADAARMATNVVRRECLIMQVIAFLAMDDPTVIENYA